MRLFYFVLFLILIHPVHGQNKQVDEATARISFVFLDDEVDGTIEGFEFTGTINGSNIENSEFSGSVLMETLDTNNWFRDRHLRAKKYFSAKAYPKLSFTGTNVTPMGQGFQVVGMLTIKGISKETTFFFKDSGADLRGTTSINTSDFDINIHKSKERNKVDITIVLPYSISE